VDTENSEHTESVCVIATPLTSNIINLLLGEIRQAGILDALSPAVVVNSGSHFRWIVPRITIDGMGKQSELKQNGIFRHSPLNM
jgi:hypothetical protein